MKPNIWVQKVFHMALILSLLIYLAPIPAAHASPSLATVASISDKLQGERVTISGTADTSDVIVKVFSPADQSYYVRSLPVQDKRYEASFLLASDAKLGRYTVIVGQGTEVTRTTFVVLKRAGTDIDSELEDALNQLSIGFRNGDTWESVTSDIFLLSVGKHETKVSWASSLPSVLSIGDGQGTTFEGQVKHQEEEQSVVVTASVSKNNRSASRPFLLIIKSKNATKTSVKDNVRTVKVVGENGGFTNLLSITRIVMSDQSRIDKTIMDSSAVDQIIDKSQVTGEKVSRLLMDHPANDVPDEQAIQIAAGGISTLANNGMSIQVETETAILGLDNSVLQRMKQQSMDLYFRIVPVRDEQKREVVATRVLQEQLVNQAASSVNGKATVVGTPQKIETNYRNFATKLLIPFNGIVPAGNQDAFLKGIRVFIEHSDGEKELATGKIVYQNGQPYGIEIEIDKFSTFTLVQLDQTSKSNSNGSADSSPADTTAIATLDGNRITIEHDGANEGIVKEHFEVTVNGKKIPVTQVILENGKIILVLEHSVRPGDLTAVVYTGDLSSNSDIRKKLFSMKVKNTGQHHTYVFGYPDGKFRPEKAISRAEMAALLSRVYENRQGEISTYEDVDAAHWAYQEIKEAGRLGLMKGMGDGTFQPERSINRAEMASIVSAWMNLREFAEVRASDTKGHWGEQTIARVMASEVMDGYPDGTFQPERQLTRAEAVTILNRLLQRGPLYGMKIPTWSDVPGTHWAFGHIEEASTEHRFEWRAEGGEMKSE
ncbi:S-layer homology domain-containing protein [Paenibacillus sp. N3.4]|uniref:S-layer homology domain-containing protein n=1 Tax=Paenibacillus sp. N3.4 TaxID=2603222 RepID=UPI00164FA0A4|nr:S-layer homology domain-containing protein [Paenibacillus sp. N3.4]